MKALRTMKPLVAILGAARARTMTASMAFASILAAGMPVAASLFLLSSVAGASETMASRVVSTTTSSTTSSSFPQGYDARIFFAVFAADPLRSVEINVKYDDLNYGGIFDLDSSNCTSLADGATTTHDGANFDVTFDAPSGGLTQSQNVLSCTYFTHEPASPSEESWFVASLVGARNLADETVTSSTHLCVTHFDVNGVPAYAGPGHLCGDANADDDITASDALVALRAALGLGSCAGSRCDTDADQSISAGDALRILRRSSSMAVTLLCAASC